MDSQKFIYTSDQNLAIQVCRPFVWPKTKSWRTSSIPSDKHDLVKRNHNHEQNQQQAMVGNHKFEAAKRSKQQPLL